jgi:hypothetical protein
LFKGTITPCKHAKEHDEVKPNLLSSWLRIRKLPQQKKMPKWGSNTKSKTNATTIQEHKALGKGVAHEVDA